MGTSIILNSSDYSLPGANPTFPFPFSLLLVFYSNSKYKKKFQSVVIKIFGQTDRRASFFIQRTIDNPISPPIYVVFISNFIYNLFWLYPMKTYWNPFPLHSFLKHAYEYWKIILENLVVTFSLLSLKFHELPNRLSWF